MSKTVRRTLLAGTVLASAITFAGLPAFAQSADQLNAAQKWIDQEFQPSTRQGNRLATSGSSRRISTPIAAAIRFRRA